MTFDVLIPNRWSWDGVCLTIESIIRRTTDSRFRIIVADNSAVSSTGAAGALVTDDGNRRDYLRALAAAGAITLIEVGEGEAGSWRYGHGENIRRLLRASTSDYAMIINSGVDVLRGDWLSILGRMLQTRDDLGVARERPAVNHFDTAWRAPCFWPNFMMLDMVLYRSIADDRDWDLDFMSLSEYPHPEQFAGLDAPKTPELSGGAVFCDTGWRLWERLRYHNPANFHFEPLPDSFLGGAVAWIGGVDRCAHHYRDWLAELDDKHPAEAAHVGAALDLIDVRLKIVREGNDQSLVV